MASKQHSRSILWSSPSSGIQKLMWRPSPTLWPPLLHLHPSISLPSSDHPQALSHGHPASTRQRSKPCGSMISITSSQPTRVEREETYTHQNSPSPYPSPHTYSARQCSESSASAPTHTYARPWPSVANPPSTQTRSPRATQTR